MGCTLGRITGLPSPDSIKREGNTLNLKGTFAVDAARGRVLAAQLTGYGPHNPDEPDVAFTYDTSDGDVDIDGDLDGWYTVVTVDVDYVKLAAGLFSWSAELVALPGSKTPSAEVLIDGADRTDTDDTVTVGVDPRPCIGIPGTTFERLGNDGTLTELVGLDTETGDVSLLVLPNDYSVRSIYYRADPAAAYQGAARIDTSIDGGANWDAVVGLQLPDTPAYWRVVNDWVSFTALPDGGIRAGFWDPTNGWEEVDFHIGDFTAGAFAHPITWDDGAVTVLRNQAAVVTLRVSLPGVVALGSVPGGYLDLTLRRGFPAVECYRWDPSSLKHAVYRTATDASSAIVGGIENDTAVAGNKWSLLSPNGPSQVTTGASGLYLTTPGQEFWFAISPITGLLPGASAQPTVADTYFAAVSHDEEIVAR